MPPKRKNTDLQDPTDDPALVARRSSRAKKAHPVSVPTETATKKRTGRVVAKTEAETGQEAKTGQEAEAPVTKRTKKVAKKEVIVEAEGEEAVLGLAKAGAGGFEIFIERW
ncbi:hypothetical protein BC936DRAFT_137566 [Jimgerdemannia flammicorona]|nr:hypothetical protein BC936DRAFT_137566 [Jimgerdemannia flammicorona]